MDVPRQQAPARTFVKRWRLLIVVGAVMAIIAVYASTLKPAPPEISRDSLYIDKVKRGDMLIEVRAPGRLVPKDEHWLASRSDGIVKRVLLRSGVPVKSDTLIIELDNPELQNQRDEAVLELSVEKAKLQQLIEELKNEQAESAMKLTTLRAQLGRAEIDRNAMRELIDDHLVPVVRMKKAEVTVEELQEAVSTQQQLHNSLSRVGESKLLVKRAQVAQLQHRVDLYNDLVDKLRIVAGIDGVLQAMNVESGQRITQGTILGSVARQDDLKAELRVAESEAGRVALGQRAVIDVNSKPVIGNVSRINPVVRNGTVTIDVIFTDPLPSAARSDLRIDGSIEIARAGNTLYIPKPVQAFDGDVTNLYVVQGDRASKRPVKVGKKSAMAIEVVDGLHEGDQVILSDVARFEASNEIKLN